MTTCPWCGTSYIAFQPNCQKCGGPLLPPAGHAPAGTDAAVLPPPAPRPISSSFARNLMLTDGLAITFGVFTLLGSIFTVVGLALTIAIVTAFVGLPFLGIGVVALFCGATGLMWRYRRAQTVVSVLKHGAPADGRIISVEENLLVRINHRYPWVVRYQFGFGGRDYEGVVSTLKRPDMQPGQAVCVLYLPDMPEYNALYPHP